MIEKIISGGQTGVDRAALDAGLKLGIPIGGTCPKGRLAEDGTIDKKYPLIESHSASYYVRTEINVMNGDGTLILFYGKWSGGTKETKEYAEKHHKPYLAINLNEPGSPKNVLAWIKASKIKVLNVAGPRESKHPGIHLAAYNFLLEVFK